MKSEGRGGEYQCIYGVKAEVRVSKLLFDLRF